MQVRSHEKCTCSCSQRQIATNNVLNSTRSQIHTHTRPHRKIPRQIIRRSQCHCSFPAQGLKSIDTNMGVNTLILWWTSKWCADVHHVHRKMHFEALPFAADCDSPVLCTLGLSFEGPAVGWTMMNQPHQSSYFQSTASSNANSVMLQHFMWVGVKHGGTIA